MFSLFAQNISNNAIRSKGCAAFAEMLDSNTTLKTLSLKGNCRHRGWLKRIIFSCLLLCLSCVTVMTCDQVVASNVQLSTGYNVLSICCNCNNLL